MSCTGKTCIPPGFKPWDHAPAQVEQTYTRADAVIFGSLLISLLRHAGRVCTANLAQLVNFIAPIMTSLGGPAWRQTLFYPFFHAARWGRGEVVFSRVESPTYTTQESGEVPFVDVVALRCHATDMTTIFAINRSLNESLIIHLPDWFRCSRHITLTHDDPMVRNTMETPDCIFPRQLNALARFHSSLGMSFKQIKPDNPSRHRSLARLW